MNWKLRQKQMIEELNKKVFSKDPLRLIRETYSSMDVVNSNYIKELKNRENYHSDTYENWFIEKIKYDFLVNQAKIENKIPGYICRFNDGVNVNKLKNAIETTSFEKLKKIEQKGEFAESVYSLKDNRKIEFCHQGHENNWKKNLNQDLIGKMNNYYKDDLNKFGYDI